LSKLIKDMIVGKRKVGQSLVWNTTNGIIKQLVQLLVMVWIAKYLSPKDLGIYAILLLILSMSRGLASFGVGQAVIFRAHLSRSFLSTMLYFNILTSAILFFVIYISAETISKFFNDPELVNVIKLGALTVLLTGVTVINRSLMERHLMFKTLFVVETCCLLIASFVAIAMTLSTENYGVYSLVFYNLTNSILLFVLFLVLLPIKPLIIFRFRFLRQIFGYAGSLTSFNLVNIVARNSDTFIIAKFLGSASLGIYSLGYKVMITPLQMVSKVFGRVFFPVFSRLRSNMNSLKSAYSDMLFLISFITFPMMLGVTALADILILSIFGEKWEGLIFLVMVLAPVGLIQSISTSTGVIHMAVGTTSTMFKVGTLNSIVVTLSFFIGSLYSLEAVALIYAAANLLMLHVNLSAAWRKIDFSYHDSFKAVGLNFFNSVVMALILVCLKGVLDYYSYNYNTQSLLLLPLGIIIYIFLVCITNLGRLKVLLSSFTDSSYGGG
jgi:O-antigen/teichoic acid export membrane protein